MEHPPRRSRASLVASASRGRESPRGGPARTAARASSHRSRHARRRYTGRSWRGSQCSLDQRQGGHDADDHKDRGRKKGRRHVVVRRRSEQLLIVQGVAPGDEAALEMPVIADARHKNTDAKQDERQAEVARANSPTATTPLWRRWLNSWAMVKPKLMSDSAVRTELINVRSALINVRSNDKAVRFEDSSNCGSSRNAFGSALSRGASAISSLSLASVQRHAPSPERSPIPSIPEIRRPTAGDRGATSKRWRVGPCRNEPPGWLL